MSKKIQMRKKDSIPILMTIALVIAEIIFYFFPWYFPNTNFKIIAGIVMGLSLLINIGFLIAMFLGIKTKKPLIVWFSVTVNSLLFIIVSVFIYVLTFSVGISGP
jgi:hypothetical protein